MDEQCNDSKNGCVGRRQFLVTAIAGGLLLSFGGASLSAANGLVSVDENKTVVPLDEKSPLNTVGGSVTVDTPVGKVVIARTSESTFVAVSAKCTHKGGPLGYDKDSGLFVCEWHGSKFGADGSNQGPPAKTPVKAYEVSKTNDTVVVTT